jgi:hypothetical protein
VPAATAAEVAAKNWRRERVTTEKLPQHQDNACGHLTGKEKRTGGTGDQT